MNINQDNVTFDLLKGIIPDIHVLSIYNDIKESLYTLSIRDNGLILNTHQDRLYLKRGDRVLHIVKVLWKTKVQYLEHPILPISFIGGCYGDSGTQLINMRELICLQRHQHIVEVARTIGALLRPWITRVDIGDIPTIPNTSGEFILQEDEYAKVWVRWIEC